MLLGPESPMRTERNINAMSEFHDHEWMMKWDHKFPHDQHDPDFSLRSSQAVHAVQEFHSQQKYQPTSEFHGFNSIDIVRFNYKSNGASFLCNSLSMFPCLKELNLINLNILVIPDDVCSLQFLEKLDWSGNDFETLPETMNRLPRLKYASLCNCSRLKAMPELVQLETVKLSGCMNLQSLFKISHPEPDWGRFQLLELWVDDCKNIRSISDQLGDFNNLTYIDLSNNDFETLPSSIIDLSSLRTLSLNNCKKIKSIKGFPLCLNYLYAHGCESLETISLPMNHSIKHFDLSHCFRLKQDENLVTQFLKEGQDEEDSPRFACFPGTEVPNYFDTIATGKSYTIGLPWPTPKMLGFDGCIMITCERPFHIQFSPLSYDYNWGYERYFYLYLQPNLFHCPEIYEEEEEDAEVKSDHLIIIRGIKNISKSINKFGINSSLQISKEKKSPSAEIKSCGFSLIWEEDDLRDKEDTAKEKLPSSNLKS